MRCFSPISEIEIHTFSFQPIDSRMYVLLSFSSQGNAVIIDPCVSEEVAALLRSNGISNLTVLLTHEHYDHISGLDWLRERFACRAVCSEACAAAIQSPLKNKSKYFPVLFMNHPPEIQEQVKLLGIQPTEYHADDWFHGEKELEFGRFKLLLRTVPGHTAGSMAVLLGDNCLFSGDSLLRIPPILRRPEGNRAGYYAETLPWFLSLGPDAMVYPGHGDPGYLREMYTQTP